MARGLAEENLALSRAGAYLADVATIEQLEALAELERGLPPMGRIHLAARMRFWEVLRVTLEETLEEGPAWGWDAVELVAEQQFLPTLPLLVDHYLCDEEWTYQEWIADAGLQLVLRGLQLDRKRQTLKRGWKEMPAWVFINAAGKAMDPDNFRSRVWPKLLAKAELRRIRIHDLRHSYASLLIGQGEKAGT